MDQPVNSSLGTEYLERIIQPLALGKGVAAFFAHTPESDDVWSVTAGYEPGLGASIDPDMRTRAREAIVRMHSAKEIAATQGLKAVVV